MRKASILVVVLGLSTGWAHADLSPVGSCPSEPNFKDILTTIYSTPFTSGANWGGASYTSDDSSITATRVDDFTLVGGNRTPGSNLHLVSGSPGLPVTDQVWTDGLAKQILVEARFSGVGQSFGYDLDGAGGAAPIVLFPSVPNGYSTLPPVSVDFTGVGTWEWFEQNKWYSREGSNSDNDDHMLTYEVCGASPAGQKVWLLFWNDNFGGGDRDYNDLVIEVRAVPAPAALLLGAMGLRMVGWLKRRADKKAEA